MIDFGDDALTQGRAHPMIDQRTRLDRIAAEAADPAVTVLLLDVVLGHGAHPDPASELAPAIDEARSAAPAAGRELAVVVSLCATTDDPQDSRRQAELLHAAGAAVFLSNAAAARHAVTLTGGAR
jgi:FdrA protein